MQTNEVKVGARVKGTTSRGATLTGTVKALDTSGKRGAFVTVDGGGSGEMKFRPSQLEQA